MSRKIRFKSSADARFYLYVSDTKVNMLFEQIRSTAKRSLHGELKVRTGIIDGSVSTASEDDVPDRDDKLRAVEDFLVKQGVVGTPQDPKDYFKGTLPMRWGLYNDLGSRPEGSPTLVYFGGFDPTTPLVLGLGGSSMHVLGHSGATSTYSRSATPTLVRWIVKGLYDEEGVDRLQRKLELGVGGDLFEGICVALFYLRQPTQQLEFVAKTLCVGNYYGFKEITGSDVTRVVLGTPLYVQQVRHLPDPSRFGLDDEFNEHLKKSTGIRLRMT